MLRSLTRKFSKQAPPKTAAEALKAELLTNPEFDRVFPHLLQYKQRSQIPIEKKELDFIASLFYKWRTTGESIDMSELKTKNLQLFSEGFNLPGGPLKAQSDEERLKTHIMAEVRLEELEESGLSREEILEPESGKVGLRLGEDPFFRYIKANRLARELVIGPNGEFTPQSIVRLALRQDVGVDRASSVTQKRRVDPAKASFKKRFELETSHSPDEELASPKDFFSQEKGLDYRDYEDDSHTRVKEPIPYHNHNYGTRRLLDLNELHWRNTPALAEFLNAYGSIKPRKYTRLSILDQKKVAKVIRISRAMKLLPENSFLMAHHMIPLRTLDEDLENAMERHIDLETGVLRLKERAEASDWFNRDGSDFGDAAEALERYDTGIDGSTYNLTHSRVVGEDEQRVFRASRYANYLQREHVLGDHREPNYDKKGKEFMETNQDSDENHFSRHDEVEGDRQAYEELLADLGEIDLDLVAKGHLFEKAISTEGLELIKEEQHLKQEMMQEEQAETVEDLMEELRELKKEIVNEASEQETLVDFLGNVAEERVFRDLQRA